MKKLWIKRYGEEDFDMPIGCQDGAEVSEVVDKKSIGLYRDDGLAILQSLSGPQIELKRKDIPKMFKTADLNITFQASLRIFDFLGVHSHLNNGTL